MFQLCRRGAQCRFGERTSAGLAAAFALAVTAVPLVRPWRARLPRSDSTSARRVVGAGGPRRRLVVARSRRRGRGLAGHRRRDERCDAHGNARAQRALHDPGEAHASLGDARLQFLAEDGIVRQEDALERRTGGPEARRALEQGLLRRARVGRLLEHHVDAARWGRRRARRGGRQEGVRVHGGRLEGGRRGQHVRGRSKRRTTREKPPGGGARETERRNSSAFSRLPSPEADRRTPNRGGSASTASAAADACSSLRLSAALPGFQASIPWMTGSVAGRPFIGWLGLPLPRIEEQRALRLVGKVDPTAPYRRPCPGWCRSREDRSPAPQGWGSRRPGAPARGNQDRSPCRSPGAGIPCCPGCRRRCRPAFASPARPSS